MIVFSYVMVYILGGLLCSWAYYRHRWNKIVLQKKYRHPAILSLNHNDHCDHCWDRTNSRRRTPLEQWTKHEDGTQGKSLLTFLGWPVILLYWTGVTLALFPIYLAVRAFLGMEKFWKIGLPQPKEKVKV